MRSDIFASGIFVADLSVRGPSIGSDAHVVSLHRHLFADGSLDRIEAEALFDLERAALSRCESWTAFFVQAITDHVVWGERPTGRLDEAQARWLLAQVDATRTPTAFALLVNVLDETQSAPSWFSNAVRARAISGWPGVSASDEALRDAEKIAA